MTNRIKGNHFRSMPLLSLASRGSALVRKRMARVNRLLAAAPHVRLKAMLRPGAQVLSEGAGKLPNRAAGNQIAAKYLRLTQVDDVEMPNNGGEN